MNTKNTKSTRVSMILMAALSILVIVSLRTFHTISLNRPQKSLHQAFERKGSTQIQLRANGSRIIRDNHVGFSFDVAASKAYYEAVGRRGREGGGIALKRSDNGALTTARRVFNVTTWDQKGTGGLQEEDRVLLGRIYGTAGSIFEYGLGESTYIANHVGVPRYAGIDSDAAWVSMTREKVDTGFRFYFADIGTTKAWGYPRQSLAKAAYNYQILPLAGEREPFDVYMVDGRFRVGCVLTSFLHASARGAEPSSTTVLLHDCFKDGHTNPGIYVGPRMKRKIYGVADHILDLVEHSGNRLCVYKRKNTTTDEQIYDLWEKVYKELE